MPLALYTFGQFTQPAEHEVNAGFFEMNDPIFDLADRAPGLIARSGYAMDEGTAPWGPEVYPAFYTERGDGWSPATLSLWEDMESLFAFTYSGLHAKAMKRGREWFEVPTWPPLVLWWHQEAARPTWAKGVERLMLLHENGPSPEAFTFREAFDEAGSPVVIDKTRVRALRAETG